jgi:transposase-like protein
VFVKYGRPEQSLQHQSGGADYMDQMANAIEAYKTSFPHLEKQMQDLLDFLQTDGTRHEKLNTTNSIERLPALPADLVRLRPLLGPPKA